eukprot:4847835-Pyramimonas_sp.AAC.1
MVSMRAVGSLTGRSLCDPMLICVHHTHTHTQTPHPSQPRPPLFQPPGGSCSAHTFTRLGCLRRNGSPSRLAQTLVPHSVFVIRESARLELAVFGDG